MFRPVGIGRFEDACFGLSSSPRAGGVDAEAGEGGARLPRAAGDKAGLAAGKRREYGAGLPAMDAWQWAQVGGGVGRPPAERSAQRARQGEEG